MGGDGGMGSTGAKTWPLGVLDNKQKLQLLIRPFFLLR